MTRYRLLIVVAMFALIACMAVGCGKKDAADEGGEGPEVGMPGDLEGGAPGAPGGPGGPGAGPPSGPGAPPGPEPSAPPSGPGPAAPSARGEGAAPVEEDKRPEMSAEDIEAALKDAKKAKSAGDLDTALKLVADVIKAKPQDVEANWLGAWVLAEKKDTALAIGQFERVLKLGLDEKRAKQARAAIKRLKAREE